MPNPRSKKSDLRAKAERAVPRVLLRDRPLQQPIPLAHSLGPWPLPQLAKQHHLEAPHACCSLLVYKETLNAQNAWATTHHPHALSLAAADCKDPQRLQPPHRTLPFSIPSPPIGAPLILQAPG